MKLHFATTNANKVPGAARALTPFGIEVLQYRLDIPEVQAETAAAVAEAKAAWAFDRLRQPVMVIDSAFHVPALGGFPGPNVKWATKQIGLDGYVRLMAHLPDPDDRVCWFEDALACVRADGEPPRIFTRRVPGRLDVTPRDGDLSQAKSALWRLFIPDGHELTLAAMSPEEFAAHRAEVKSFYEDFGRWFIGG